MTDAHMIAPKQWTSVPTALTEEEIVALLRLHVRAVLAMIESKTLGKAALLPHLIRVDLLCRMLRMRRCRRTKRMEDKELIRLRLKSYDRRIARWEGENSVPLPVAILFGAIFLLAFPVMLIVEHW